jgi:ribosome-binding ATPase YchF (GTP1/OBG family)
LAAYLVELLLRDSTPTEEEISQLEDDEAVMFLEEMGLAEAGLDRLIKAGYELLHLEPISRVVRKKPARGLFRRKQKRGKRRA